MKLVHIVCGMVERVEKDGNRWRVVVRQLGGEELSFRFEDTGEQLESMPERGDRFHLTWEKQ